jgi:hypothetical protein
MKANLAKRLQKMEQDVQARQASVRSTFNGAEIVRGWLRAWGVQQQPEESLAETLARALGISMRELRDRLHVPRHPYQRLRRTPRRFAHSAISHAGGCTVPAFAAAARPRWTWRPALRKFARNWGKTHRPSRSPSE